MVTLIRIQPWSIIVANLYKVLVLVILGLIPCYLFFYIEVSDELVRCAIFNKRKCNYVVELAVSVNRHGEYALAQRVKHSMAKLGWEYYIHKPNDKIVSLPIIKQFALSLDWLLGKYFKPEFILVLNDHAEMTWSKPKYLYVNVYPDFFITINNQFHKDYVKEFDGYVDLNMYGKAEDKYVWLKNALESNNKENFVIMRGILAMPDVEYQQAQVNKIIFVGTTWGAWRSGRKHSKLVMELAKQEDMDVYGAGLAWEFLGDSYRGAISEKDFYILIAKIRDYGVALCTHTLDHLDAGIPTNRVFEAIAAGAIPIVDQNYFITKEFGDNVLYIDQNDSFSNILEQVNKHLLWLRNHPSAVRVMAKKNYDLAMAKFNITTHLLNIRRMHNYFKNHNFEGRHILYD
jgi:hypothetical protein